MVTATVAHGDVWLCALDPTVGSETQKTQPCVVVSPDELNASLRTVIVAPLTSGSRPARFRVVVHLQGVEGLILPDQLQTLDRARLIKRMGKLDAATLGGVLKVLGEMFAA